jgi:hypothetical protein
MILELALSTLKEFQETYNIYFINRETIFFLFLIITLFSIKNLINSNPLKDKVHYRCQLTVNNKFVKECSASWLFYNLVNNISENSFNMLIKKKIIDIEILITNDEFYKLDKQKQREYRKIKSCHVLCRFDYKNSRKYIKKINKILSERVEIKFL